MTTEPVSKSLDEIRSLIIDEVRRYPEFRDVTPQHPYWHEPDTDGCNWDLSIWQGPVEMVQRAKVAVTPAVQELRRKYRAPTP